MSYNNSVNRLKDCGNATNEDGRKTDPLTLESLPKDLTLLIKIGNQCYNRQSLRDFLLSKDSNVAINLDDGTMDEWTTGAYPRIRDPMTNLPFSLAVLTQMYYFTSHNRERAAKGFTKRKKSNKRRGLKKRRRTTIRRRRRI